MTTTLPFGAWSNTFTSIPTLLTTIDPSHVASLSSYIASITQAVATETDHVSLFILNQSMRGALARMTIISAEEVLATATSMIPTETLAPGNYSSGTIAQANNAIMLATLNLQSLFDADNNYSANLIFVANALFAGVFGLLLLSNFGVLIWSRNWYFSICFILGTFLEFAGYGARTISSRGHEDNLDPFIAQICCLTIAPAFVMAGVYFLLAELIVVQGRKSSVLKPSWFSYIFIACDFISLVVQAAGGALAAMASKKHTSAALGSNVMLGGIAFQVVTMSFFVYFLFDYFYRSTFCFPSLAPVSAKSFFQVFFGTTQGKMYQKELHRSYDPRFSIQREHSPGLFRLLPIGIFVAVALIYVRCVYRVVELAQGWDGYLITTEIFLFTLDGAMVFLACVICIIFHPAFVFGKNNGLNKAIGGKYPQFDEGFELVNDNTEQSGDDVPSVTGVSVERQFSKYSGFYPVECSNEKFSPNTFDKSPPDKFDVKR